MINIKVIQMGYMFQGMQKIKTLDLSNFVLLPEAGVNGMFSGSLTEKVYVSSQSVAEKISPRKPDTLNFMIK